jgi:hypothetical protein
MLAAKIHEAAGIRVYSVKREKLMPRYFGNKKILVTGNRRLTDDVC